MTNKLPVVGKRYKYKESQFNGILKGWYMNQIIPFGIFQFDNGMEIEIRGEALKDFFSEFEELPEDKVEIEPKGWIGSTTNLRTFRVNFAKGTYEEIINKNCVLCGGGGKIMSLTMPPKEINCPKCNIESCQAETKPETQSHISELSPEVKEAMESLESALNHVYEKTEFAAIDWRMKAQNLLNALDKQFNSVTPPDLKRRECNYCGKEITGSIVTSSGCCSMKCSIELDKQFAQDETDYLLESPANAERLRKSLNNKEGKTYESLDQFREQYMSKEEDKIDTRQERVDSIKVNEASESVDVKEEEVKEKESIWRPDQEITQAELMDSISAKRVILHPTEPVHFQIWNFINDHEKLKERVKKLEEK